MAVHPSTSLASGGTPVDGQASDESLAQVTWSTLDGFAVLFGAFVVYFVGSVVVGLVDFVIEGKHLGFWVIPTSYGFLTLGTVMMIRWRLLGRRHATWASIGFRLPPGQALGSALRRIAAVVGITFVTVIAAEDVIVAFFNSLTSFHIKSNVKELLPSGQSHVSLAQYLALVLVAAILAPITEETLFRGVLYQGMRRRIAARFGTRGAIAIAAVATGTLFGLFHLVGGTGEINTLPVLIFLGIALALAFQSAGSLAGSMVVHASFNFLAVTLLFARSG